MKTTVLSSAIALCAGLLPPSTDSGASPPRAQEEGVEARLTRAVERFVAEEDLGGLSLALYLGDEPLLVRRPDARVDASALMPLMLASLALDLVEVDVLSLDDPLEKFMPVLGATGQKVRVKHLLAHTSGLPPCEPWFAAHAADERFDLDSFVEWLSEEPLLGEPGQCWAPEATDEMVLAIVLELAGQRGIGGLLEERIFVPLGMRSTARTVLRPERSAQDVLGRLDSSAADLARFMRELLEGEVLETESVLALAGRARLPDGTRAGPGLGFGLASLRTSGDGNAAGGARRGASVRLVHYPEHDLVLALAAPSAEAGLAELENHLCRVVAGLEQPEPLDLPLSREERERYVGSFWAGCLRMDVEEQGEHLGLRVQFATPQRLRRIGEHRFVALEDPEIRVEFRLEGELALILVLDDHGARVEARRQ